MISLENMYSYNLGSLFASNVAINFHDRAINDPDFPLSYGDLFDAVVSLAEMLIENGVRRGDVIAIGHTKQAKSYALMLAALRLGIPYVNIDVLSPVERNKKILTKSDAKLLFYDDVNFSGTVSALAVECRCKLILLNDIKILRPSSEQIAHQQYLSAMVDGDCIAYIMFTSGSTGEPKGVAVTHQNVLHFIEWGKRRFGVDSGSNFANLSPMYFDNSVFDFFVCFFSGGVLTPVRRDLLTDPYGLVQYIDRMGCNVWFSVPSLLIYLTTMKAMKGAVLPKLRTIIFGGEGYPKTELKKLYDEFSRQSTLVNVYGPTECTCICSAHDITAKDFENLEGLPALGNLNPNFDYRVVDESNRDSSVGELCLIGPNVAAGYFNDDERTSKAFSVLKSPKRFMKRMYRTGDLVRDDGGCLYFLGRKDNQIKHMGYRIELEEIENALNGMADIKQAAVVYHRVHATHGKIIAFVAVSDDLINQVEIKRRLAALLPDYMIPSSIIVLEELPKNANGKVDRALLGSEAQVG